MKNPTADRRLKVRFQGELELERDAILRQPPGYRAKENVDGTIFRNARVLA
jgi:hypothetical protein